MDDLEALPAHLLAPFEGFNLSAAKPGFGSHSEGAVVPANYTKPFASETNSTDSSGDKWKLPLAVNFTQAVNLTQHSVQPFNPTQQPLAAEQTLKAPPSPIGDKSPSKWDLPLPVTTPQPAAAEDLAAFAPIGSAGSNNGPGKWDLPLPINKTLPAAAEDVAEFAPSPTEAAEQAAAARRIKEQQAAIAAEIVKAIHGPAPAALPPLPPKQPLLLPNVTKPPIKLPVSRLFSWQRGSPTTIAFPLRCTRCGDGDAVLRQLGQESLQIS